MSTLGSTPSWNSYRFYLVNVENQATTGAYTMPENGVITAVVFYASSDPSNSPTNFVGCVWLNGNAALLCSGSVVSVGAGSESVGGQGWVTSGGINQFCGAGTQIKIGWTRAPGGSMLFSLNTGGEGYVAQGGNPGNLGTLEPVGQIGAYIVYTPVSAPGATTSAATGVTTTAATLNGSVTPNGTDTTYSFQWGTDTSYGNTTAAGDAGSGTSAVSVSANLSSLTPGTTYHFRVVASNAAGTTYGADQTFAATGAPNAPTLNTPTNNTAASLTASGQTFTWTYNSGGAGGGQTGYALKVTRSDNNTDYWWNGSAFVTTETFVSSAAGSATIGAANWVAGISYTWTVATQDAGGTGPYASGFTLVSQSPPPPPTLSSPANASYVDLVSSPPNFAWSYNGSAASGQTGWAFRRKVSGASAYVYWSAASQAWQSSIVWNTGVIQTYAFPGAAWTDGVTYNWSVASQDSGGQGNFAADFTIVAQAPPTVRVTSPSGDIHTANPVVVWAATFPTGASQTAYQVRTFTAAQVAAAGFSPLTATPADDSGIVTSTAATSYQVATALQPGVSYWAYVNLTETGGETNAFNAAAPFTVSLDSPPIPTITGITQGADPTTGLPRLQIAVTAPFNLLTAVDSSFETGIGTFVGSNATLAQSSAHAQDGTYSLALTAASAANMSAQSGSYAVQPNTSYMALASFFAATTVRTVYVQIDWYTSGNALISSSAGGSAPDSATIWTETQVTATSPANAAFARVSVYVLSPANAEVHYVDEVGLFLGSTVISGAQYAAATGFTSFTDGFENLGSNGTLFTDPFTNALAWTTAIGSALTATGGTATLPVSSQTEAGHVNWKDGTATFRFKWVTTNDIAVAIHYIDSSNHIRAEISAAGTLTFYWRTTAAGLVTIGSIPGGTFTAVNGTFYWIDLIASGVNYSCKLYADSAGSKGAQIGSTITGVVQAAGLQNGPIGLLNFTGASMTVTAATFTALCPVGWTPSVTAGVPAFCVDAINVYAGLYSLSIFNKDASANGVWTDSNGGTVGASQNYILSAQMKVTGAGSATFSVAGAGAISVTQDGTWRAALGAGVVLNAGFFSQCRMNGAGTANWDNVTINPATLAPTYGSVAYGGTGWSIGGLLSTSEIAILRSDGVYVRNASLTTPTPLNTTTLSIVIYDYEAAPLTAYTYQAIALAQESNATVQSLASSAVGATLITTQWWEVDPTDITTTVSAQPTQFNSSHTEQSSAHGVLGQTTMNVVAYAMQGTDMQATFETFDAPTYTGLRALALSQKTVFISSPFGESYYFRLAPQPGGMSTGMGNRAHDAQLLPSSAGGPHRVLQLTGISQPRPPV